jgi:catechol 2,3-dioxygenase-like lactoylglutathione lyase family enzyme
MIMHVNALDHINIITADLTATARFYADMFSLEVRNAPPPLTPEDAQWVHDGEGRAIIHINSLTCPRAYEREVTPGPTGSIHHVALNCSGYDGAVAKLEAQGMEFQCNLVAAIGLRQIFTMDPNGVLLELNFFAD